MYIYIKTWGSGEYEEEEADQPDNSPPETPDPPSCVVPALFGLSWACLNILRRKRTVGFAHASVRFYQASQPETPEPPSVRCSSAIRINFGIVQCVWTKTLVLDPAFSGIKQDL